MMYECPECGSDRTARLCRTLAGVAMVCHLCGNRWEHLQSDTP